MFQPDIIFYEKAIESYSLGKELLQKFSHIPKVMIENHNKSDLVLENTITNNLV